MELCASLGDCVECGASVEKCGADPGRCCSHCDHVDALSEVYTGAYAVSKERAFRSLPEHNENALAYARSDLEYAWSRVAHYAGEVAGIEAVLER